jgi:hypothetical protein
MKYKSLITLMLTAASLAGAASATEIVERKALTLDGAQRAIAAAVAQAHKNHAGGVPANGAAQPAYAIIVGRSGAARRISEQRSG